MCEVRARSRSSRAFFGWLRAGDYAAGDARRGAGGNFRRDRVKHERGAAIAENGIAFVAEADVRSDHAGVRGAIGPDGQNKIGDVARGHAHRTMLGMARASAIEMSARGFEVGGFAFW